MDSEEGSDFFDGSASEDEQTWIEWFLSLRNRDVMVSVPMAYIEDEFNLTGLNVQVPLYNEALCLIKDLEFEDETNRVIQVSQVEKAAELLYALIHQRYLLTKPGLSAMSTKYKRGDFGTCPRLMCQSTKVIPIGLSDLPMQAEFQLFCPNCVDVYSSGNKYTGVDGVAFGTTFPHLFFLSMPEMFEEPKGYGVYVPRIFGFKVHQSSVTGNKIPWLRQRAPYMSKEAVAARQTV